MASESWMRSPRVATGRGLRSRGPFWQPRYYDFNVFHEQKLVEKLDYMHQNPVQRGLVTRPEDWKWSRCTPLFDGGGVRGGD